MSSFSSQQWGIPSARFLLDTLIKSLSLRDATLSTDSLRFPCNIAFIAVCDNCFAFSRRNCWHKGQKLRSSDMHFQWKECEHPSNISKSSSPVTVQLGKSHLLFSFEGLELQWPCGSILVFIFSSPNNFGSCTLVFLPWPLRTAFPGCLAIFWKCICQYFGTLGL